MCLSLTHSFTDVVCFFGFAVIYQMDSNVILTLFDGEEVRDLLSLK